MINLLPPELKQMRMYGRRNRGLVRWCCLCLAAVAGLVAIAGGGYFFISRAEAAAKDAKTQTEAAIATAKLDQVEKDYAAFSSNLKTVTQILSKQILFSELIQKIGGVIPPGATLNSVSLSDKDNALSLDFKVTNPSIAPTLQVNLEDADNELFEKADIIQVSCQNEAGATPGCTVQVRALYRKDAKFIFLNSVSNGATR